MIDTEECKFDHLNYVDESLRKSMRNSHTGSFDINERQETLSEEIQRDPIKSNLVDDSLPLNDSEKILDYSEKNKLQLFESPIYK